jgi:hypothetical protein
MVDVSEKKFAEGVIIIDEAKKRMCYKPYAKRMKSMKIRLPRQPKNQLKSGALATKKSV